MADAPDRGSDRVSLMMGIIVSGTDITGEVFVADGKTILVSRRGAKILLPRPLAAHQEINIQCIETRMDADARVVGQIGRAEGGVYYGVAFTHPDANIWGIEIPPVAEDERAIGRVILECGGCHIRELTYLDGNELEVLESNHNLALYCKRCANFCVFKKTSLGPGGPDIAPPVAIPARHEDLRGERRRNVNVLTCVRSRNYGDDIARSRNASRGGLSFESSRHYSLNTKVEVAIPYNPSGGNIFMAGNIIRVIPAKDGKLTAYGVQYLKRPA